MPFTPCTRKAIRTPSAEAASPTRAIGSTLVTFADTPADDARVRFDHLDALRIREAGFAGRRQRGEAVVLHDAGGIRLAEARPVGGPASGRQLGLPEDDRLRIRLVRCLQALDRVPGGGSRGRDDDERRADDGRGGHAALQARHASNPTCCVQAASSSASAAPSSIVAATISNALLHADSYSGFQSSPAIAASEAMRVAPTTG